MSYYLRCFIILIVESKDILWIWMVSFGTQGQSNRPLHDSHLDCSGNSTTPYLPVTRVGVWRGAHWAPSVYQILWRPSWYSMFPEPSNTLQQITFGRGHTPVWEHIQCSRQSENTLNVPDICCQCHRQMFWAYMHTNLHITSNKKYNFVITKIFFCLFAI